MAEKFNTGSHDLPISAELAEFMRGGWADTHADPSPLPVAPYAAKRRARLA
ncbi:MAG: aminopeptidase P family protein, partial [Microbispora sp.]|nr:aminopeptidase P family protein [Microbispora sp.]